MAKDEIEKIERTEKAFLEIFGYEGRQYVKFMEEFMEDYHAINPRTNAKLIKNVSNYFKNLSDENLAKIQPEFMQVMGIMNQKKLIKTELLNALNFQYVMHRFNKTNQGCRTYVLSIPEAMYNINPQIKAYSEAISNKEYNKSLEGKLLGKMIPFIGARPKRDEKLGIIALGCGLGDHEYEFALNFIKQKRLREDRIRLYLTDVSNSMVEQAVANAQNRNLKRIKEGKKPIDTLGFQLDFTKCMIDADNIAADDYRVFLLLGTTLGNFKPLVQKVILYNVCLALRDLDDNLVVGVKGIDYKNGEPDAKRMMQEYSLSGKFAYKMLEISGIERQCLSDYTISFGFNKYKDPYKEPNHRDKCYTIPEIICSFPLIKDIELQFEGKLKINNIRLYKGDRINMINSQRFTQNTLNGLISPIITRADKNVLPDEGYYKPYSTDHLKTKKILEEDGYIVGLYESKDLAKVRNKKRSR